MELKVKKLTSSAVLPVRAHSTDSGWDLSSIENVNIWPHEHVVVRTGLAFGFPPGFEGQIRPRSGLAANHGITVLNAPATLDNGFSGEVKVVIVNHSDKLFQVHCGMRIAQLVLQKVYSNIFLEEVYKLEATARGDKGFGSSGI